jgi:serine/threonine protein kinase
LAIKELHSSDPSEFQKESDMLCALATGNHKHLIKLLATYKFRGRYHLLFPYADNNLRGYWDHIGVPYWNRETCLWFLNQASGIASALNAIHNFEARVPLGSEQDRRGKYLTVAIAEAKFGRHGDIKPENILWFNEMQDAEHGGILQIADFGLGRFHRLESRSKVDPRSVAGSLSYSPPEVALGKAVSRAYDMWSLGCVFLEFVTWLLEGSSSIYKFSDQRLSKALDGAQDDTFFSLTTDGKITTGAVMRGGVTSWIDRLRKHPQYSEMVRDLLDIVQNHLLVIDTERRMKSDVLYKQLNKILNRAKTEEKYLLGDVRTQKSADYTLARSNDTKVDGPLIRVVECK